VATFEAIFITRTGVSVLHLVFIIFHESIFVFGNWFVNLKRNLGGFA